MVRSWSSRPLMNGMLPTTTTAVPAPAAASTAESTPLLMTSLAKRPASSFVVRTSVPSSWAFRYVFAGSAQS